MSPKSSVPGFSPGLAGLCLRYAVMDMLRFGRELDPESLAAMHEGSRRHRAYQAELKAGPGVIAIERRVADASGRIAGRMDAVVTWRDRPQVIEYKTVNGSRFEQICATGPLISHVAQLLLYLELTGYDQGRLVVESRETGERREYSMTSDPGWASWLRERSARALAAADQHQLPEREVSAGCLSCDRWRRCFKDVAERSQRVAAHPLWEPDPALPQSPAASAL